MRILALLLVLMTAGAGAARATDQNFEGLWLTENKRSVIAIKECDQGLCGKIHWIIADGMKTDANNTDEAKRGTPMCGLPILWGFTQESPVMWTQGSIYKADEGDTYNATLQMLPTGNILARGYVGMPLFGKSQTWTRVSAAEYPACR